MSEPKHHPIGVPFGLSVILFMFLGIAVTILGVRWNNPNTQTYILVAWHWHATPRTATDCPTVAALKAASERLRDDVTAEKRDVVARVLRGKGC